MNTPMQDQIDTITQCHTALSNTVDKQIEAFTALQDFVQASDREYDIRISDHTVCIDHIANHIEGNRKLLYGVLVSTVALLVTCIILLFKIL